MPLLRRATLVDAPPPTVAGAVREVATVRAAVARCGHAVCAPGLLISVGDELLFRIRLLPGLSVRLRTRVTAMSAGGMRSVQVRGPFPELEHDVTLTPSAAGTRMVDELRWRAPLGPLADVVAVRRMMRQLLAARSAFVGERAVALAAAPVVVATALVRDGTVLAAQRTRPPALAGRWELPGGRVEAGEAEPDAVVRECGEELGTTVRPGVRLGTDLPIDAGVLRVHTATLAPGAPEPRALEHATLRWVAVEQAPMLDWVDADRAVVPDLVALLREG